jgi:hypothetical protein
VPKSRETSLSAQTPTYTSMLCVICTNTFACLHSRGACLPGDYDNRVLLRIIMRITHIIHARIAPLFAFERQRFPTAKTVTSQTHKLFPRARMKKSSAAATAITMQAISASSIMAPAKLGVRAFESVFVCVLCVFNSFHHMHGVARSPSCDLRRHRCCEKIIVLHKAAAHSQCTQREVRKGASFKILSLKGA